MPPVLIELAIEPKSKADQEKMGQALGRLVQEDPAFHVSTDPETGQTVIKGMSEAQLELVIGRLQREFGIAINVGAPRSPIVKRSAAGPRLTTPTRSRAAARASSPAS